MNKLQSSSSSSYQRKHLAHHLGNTKYFFDHKLFLKKILDELDTLCGVCICMCERKKRMCLLDGISSKWSETDFQIVIVSVSP